MTDYISNIDIGEEIDDFKSWIEPVQDTNLGSHNWYGITYGDGKFVAIGSSGYISISTDGTTWSVSSQNSTLGSNSWANIAYGNGKFVAIGDSGYISTSTDGTTWSSPVQSLGSRSWTTIRYINNQFIAIGFYGYISTSTDGTTWSSPVQSIGSSSWRGIAYGDGKFVAINYTGYISTSTDGITWSSPVQIVNLSSYVWTDIIYKDNQFIIIGEYGHFSTSSDGKNWSATYHNVNLGSHYWYDIVYGDGKLVAIGSGGWISTSTRTSKIQIGGKKFDGQWEGINGANLISGSTLSGGTYYQYSLNDYLPDDGYDYEVMFWGSSLSVATSGKTCQLTLLSGYNESSTNGWRLGRCTARTAATVRAGGNAILPIFANDRYVTVFTQDSDSNNTSTYLRACGYRRIGSNHTNSQWSTPVKCLPNIEFESDFNFNGWKTLINDGNKLVALHCNGVIYTSTDGINWDYGTNIITPSSTIVFNDIIYDGTKFVAIACGKIDSTHYTLLVYYTNTDDITQSWTSSTVVDTLSHTQYNNELSIAYGNDIYTVLGIANDCYISSDLISWSRRGGGQSLVKDVVYANNYFYSLKTNGKIMRSSSGYDFVFIDRIGQYGDWTSIVYNTNDNKFVALTSSGLISTSTSSTGDSWGTPSYPRGLYNNTINQYNWKSISILNNKLIIMGNNGHISYQVDTLSNINDIQIGGNNFNGIPVIFTSDQSSLINSGTDEHNLLTGSVSIDSQAHQSYDVSDIIPDDGYDYELCISVWTATQSTSSRDVNLFVAQGSLTSRPIYAIQVGYRFARTGAQYGDYNMAWLPISHKDKWITFYSNTSTYAFTYNCAIHGYRRIGTND